MAFAETGSDVDAAIDAAYHAKYDRYGPKIVRAVVGPEAEAVTIKLLPHSARSKCGNEIVVIKERGSMSGSASPATAAGGDSATLWMPGRSGGAATLSRSPRLRAASPKPMIAGNGVIRQDWG